MSAYPQRYSATDAHNSGRLALATGFLEGFGPGKPPGSIALVVDPFVQFHHPQLTLIYPQYKGLLIWIQHEPISWLNTSLVATVMYQLVVLSLFILGYFVSLSW